MNTETIEAGIIPIENRVFGYQGVLRQGSSILWKCVHYHRVAKGKTAPPDGLSETAAREWEPAIECGIAELQRRKDETALKSFSIKPQPSN